MQTTWHSNWKMQTPGIVKCWGRNLVNALNIFEWTIKKININSVKCSLRTLGMQCSCVTWCTRYVFVIRPSTNFNEERRKILIITLGIWCKQISPSTWTLKSRCDMIFAYWFLRGVAVGNPGWACKKSYLAKWILHIYTSRRISCTLPHRKNHDALYC